MPKLGMGPIRREQICRAAATVISREGFAGTTMRLVADEAGVSTGMLNHYFANREDLLTQALVYVSERAQERMRRAVEDAPAGLRRLRMLLDSALGDDEESTQTWRVWINAYGAAVRLPSLRHTIEGRLTSWYDLIDEALEGVAPSPAPGSIPWSWRLDAVLNGLSIQALTSEAALDGRRIRDEVLRTLFGDEATEDGASGDAKAKSKKVRSNNSRRAAASAGAAAKRGNGKPAASRRSPAQPSTPKRSAAKTATGRQGAGKQAATKRTAAKARTATTTAAEAPRAPRRRSATAAQAVASRSRGSARAAGGPDAS